MNDKEQGWQNFIIVYVQYLLLNDYLGLGILVIISKKCTEPPLPFKILPIQI